MTSVIDYTYKYAFSSVVDERGMRWAASPPEVSPALREQRSATGVDTREGHFFWGKLRDSQPVCRMLSVLCRVVRTHYYQPQPPNRDPVVTSSRTTLRWEGFSGCGGVYARADLDECAFLSCQPGFGTTNVDFNAAMLAQLARVSHDDSLEFVISDDSVVVRRDDNSVTERKVELPRRWIKGFGEVQAYQSRLRPEYEVPPRHLARFLQTIPRQVGQRFLIINKNGLRQSTREQPGSVPIGGAERLKVLTPLLADADNVKVWVDRASGATAWQVMTGAGRFWLVLSPEMHRGFTGEGQLLDSLAAGRGGELIDDVHTLMKHQATIDPAELATRLGASVADIQHALMALSVQGLAGFDAESGFYFHRELPFALDDVENSQPRLKGARKLVENGCVRIASMPARDAWDLEVNSDGTLYFVRLRPDGDRCNCPWFSRYQGERGSCKHVLAARIVVNQQANERGSA